MVERSADGGTTWATLTSTLGANATGYANTTAVAGNTYLYRVTATNPASVPPAPPASTSVTVLFATPVAPTGLTLVSVVRVGTTANDTVTLNWTGVANASTYTIQRATTSAFTTVTTTTGIVGTTTSLTVPRGTPGTTVYYFRVLAVSPIGTSAPSVPLGPIGTQ